MILGDISGTEKVEMSGFISEHQVCTMIKWLEKCIISLLDKNKLCPIISCAHLFWLKLLETYIHDSIHYKFFSAISEFYANMPDGTKKISHLNLNVLSLWLKKTSGVSLDLLQFYSNIYVYT